MTGSPPTWKAPARRSTELEEEQGGEEGAFADLDKVSKANVAARLKEIKGDKEAKDEAAAFERVACS